MERTSPRQRLAELLGSLSLATDLATGQPLGHGIRTCLLSVRLATQLGCNHEQVRSVHQVALLRFLGCTAEAGTNARSVGGDEISVNRAFATVINGGTGEAIKAMVSSVGAGSPPLKRLGLIAGGLTNRKADQLLLASHCEVASMLATRLNLANSVVAALGHAYERWDGAGFPSRLKGEAIPLEIRICSVARDVDLALQAGDDPVEILSRRRAKAYDPAVVDAYADLGEGALEADWDQFLAAEPDPVDVTHDVDEVLFVMADFIDLKSQWTRGHSRRVSALAGEAAVAAGMSPEDARGLQRAGLVHDLGKVGVENGIWDKPGPLSLDEWEKVRLHPYLTERVLSRCQSLKPLATVACRHHERPDGAGYPGQVEAGQLTQSDRMLAAAQVLVALTSDRPHRPAFSSEDARQTMMSEVSEGRLDDDATRHVLEAAGYQVDRPRQANPGGLSGREIEVLKLITAERTNKEMADELFISPKTVGRHVENIYAKIGVSTRAGAALYAMEHGVLD